MRISTNFSVSLSRISPRYTRGTSANYSCFNSGVTAAHKNFRSGVIKILALTVEADTKRKISRIAVIFCLARVFCRIEIKAPTFSGGTWYVAFYDIA